MAAVEDACTKAHTMLSTIFVFCKVVAHSNGDNNNVCP